MERYMELPECFIESLDKKQKNKLKAIEDRIEQKWMAYTIIMSLNVIDSIISPQPPPNIPPETLSELEDISKELAKALPVDIMRKSPLDVIRENIWSAVNQIGVIGVLSFVDSQIVLNIEKFFSGLVVSYVAMFNKGERAALPADKIFSKNEPLKIKHERLCDLRNKWYGHVELKNGRHSIRYKLNENRDIIFNTASHSSPEYHSDEYKNLRACTAFVHNYICLDIDAKINELLNEMTEVQKGILQRYWDSKQNTEKK